MQVIADKGQGVHGSTVLRVGERNQGSRVRRDHEPEQKLRWEKLLKQNKAGGREQLG